MVLMPANVSGYTYTGYSSGSYQGYSPTWLPGFDENDRDTSRYNYPGRSPAQEAPPGVRPAAPSMTPYAQRVSSQASGLRSADAASVWARGGSAEVQSQQREWSDAWLRDWAAKMEADGKQFVGISSLSQWANGLGFSPVPWLGTSVKGPSQGTLGYQLPEYETVDINIVLNQMSPSELANFREKAKQAGLYQADMYPPSDSGPSSADTYVMTQLMARANLTKLTSWEAALDEFVTNPNAALDGTGSTYTGPTTTRSIVYQSTSIDAGRSYLRTLMRNMIGREPTDTEVQEYVAALNRQEQSRPEITEQVSEMGDNENITINTAKLLQHAPVPEEELRRSVEEGNPEEQFTYAAQGYFDRLMEII